MFSLHKKNALILGGTSGIGLAVAESFSRAGATVTAAGRRKDGKNIVGASGCRFTRLDVVNEAAFSETLAQIKATLGEIDVLVANAGIPGSGFSINEQDSVEANELVSVNLNGVFFALKHGPKHMRSGGSIIVTSSLAARLSSPQIAIYAATKAAVSSLVRSAAIELGSSNIRVNAISPGGIQTDIALPEKLFETVAPLGRIGQKSDVVGLYNFLAADASSYITGQDIAVDGGMSAGLSARVVERSLS